jgi:hypothetical protein
MIQACGTIHGCRGKWSGRRITLFAILNHPIPTCTTTTAFVDLAIAVVVDAIAAGLEGSGVDGRIAIVAVGRVRDIAVRSRTGLCGGEGVAVPIEIGVLVEGVLASLVDLAIAVVVECIAGDFGYARINSRVGIVAITGRNSPAITICVHLNPRNGKRARPPRTSPTSNTDEVLLTSVDTKGNYGLETTIIIHTC